MITAQSVAKYILSKNSLDDRDITHLKLQKLLYYCQGFHLAITGRALFDDKIQHWDHGPVVPSIYNAYKGCGSDPLPIPELFKDDIPPPSKSIIDEVLEVYDQFSPWKLRDMTHSEDPWLNTNDCEEITHEKLITYFKTRVING